MENEYEGRRVNCRSLNKSLSLILIGHLDFAPHPQKTVAFELIGPKMKWSLLLYPQLFILEQVQTIGKTSSIIMKES